MRLSSRWRDTDKSPPDQDYCEIHICSPANLFIGNGVSVVAVRFAFDYGCCDLNDPEGVRRANHEFLSLRYPMGSPINCMTASGR
jgi:hypothetical protein